MTTGNQQLRRAGRGEGEVLKQHATSEELEDLQLYRRQMEAMWEMMASVLESVNQDMHIQIGADQLEVSCPTCVRVMGVLNACTAIMRRPDRAHPRAS